MTATGARPNDVAVIGMSGRFPGANDISQFWDNLREGRETISRFSGDELQQAGVDPQALGYPGYVNAGGVLDGVELFDAAFFGFSPRDAEITDPQHRLFLECAWEAFEDGGYDPGRVDAPIGVFAGVAMSRYVFNLYSRPELMATVGPLQVLLGNDKDHLTTRTAYKLNLSGPAVTVQTACSTSLVAVSLAYQSLLDYHCDMALAGGVTIIVPQRTGYFYQVGGISSPDGHCRAFDAKAMGTVGGNGVGVVLLKRLEDALADGDAIRAVIRGAAINNDGSVKVGYTAPSIEGQAKVIAMAQAIAEVDPDTIGYIEAHGTGTPLGDPIEMAALTQVFRATTSRSAYCALGSLKTNIGHLDCAAGVAGLIKTVLALEHAELPPSLHFEQPNPKLDLASSPFYINTARQPWPSGNGARRAGVSSFGIGGTNAHVVLEEAPAPPAFHASRRYAVVPLSARSEDALDATARRMSEFFECEPANRLADVAYTCALGRRAFPHRCALVAATADEARPALDARDPAKVTRRVAHAGRKTVFLFPGQGAQHVGMGRDLFVHERGFRDSFEHCARLLRPHLGLDLTGVVYPQTPEPAQGTPRGALDQTALTQPALFAVEYALAKLLEEWGIRPHAMIGHSIGEYVAACLAGVFSLDDALMLVAARGRLMQAAAPGAMLAVSLPEAELGQYLSPEVDVASVNGPSQCVVSGPSDAIRRIETQLALVRVPARLLTTSHAFHSSMMSAAAAQFQSVVSRVRLNAPAVPFVSNVTGDWITPAEATSAVYWSAHLRRAVRFGDGLERFTAVPEWALLEVGPGVALSTLARQHPRRRLEQPVTATMRHAKDGRDDDKALLEAVAELWCGGADLEWRRFYADEARRRVHLPTYPFERQKYWIDARPSVAARPVGQEETPAKHGDIGKWFYRPVWRTSEQAPAPAESASGEKHWLVLSDDTIGPELARRVRAAGDTVTLVAGQARGGLETADYRIAPDLMEDYGRVLDALDREGRQPDLIVHAWGVDPAAPPEIGFDSLLPLARAIARRPGRPMQLLVVSSGLHAVTDSDRLVPEKATLLGPVRVIPLELPHIRCQSIDFSLSVGGLELGPMADMVLAEATSNRTDALVAYRDGTRWVQTIEPIETSGGASERSPLRQGGVYLITGGFGGIGLVLAEHLAREARARVALVGRTPLPDRSEWDTWCAGHDDTERISRAIRQIRAIEALGGEVLVVQADVADVDQMNAAVEQIHDRFGALHGVIHAAGVAGGGMIQRKTADLAARVLSPKVTGTLVLERVLRDEPLDFFVLCSSLAAVLGGFGQVDYCAANAFLDAYAHAAPSRLRVARAVSIDWDTWQQTGMAVDTTVPRELLGVRDQHLKMGMTNDEGARVLIRALEAAEPQLLVSTRDWQTRIMPVAPPASTPAVDGRDRPTVKHERPSLETPYAAARNDAEAFIATIWEEMLGVAPIGIDDDFFALGGHSLLAIQVVARLRERFEVEVPVQVLFDAPTIAQLAARVQTAADDGSTTPERLVEMVRYVEQLSDDEVQRLLASQEQRP